MAYLIIKERGEQGALLSARRHPVRTPTYGRILSDLGRLFPGRVVRSPLDTCHPRATQVVVYVSDNPRGVGRIAGNFLEWAVDPRDDPPPSP